MTYCDIDFPLYVSIFAVVIAVVTLIVSIIQFCRTRKDAFYNLIFECMKPISAFIYDALLCKDLNKFIETSVIEKAEKDLFSNADSLYSYGVGANLIYLQQFSALNLKNVEPLELQTHMCFLNALATIEDDYKKKRIYYFKNKTQMDDELREWLQSSIDLFRNCLELQSKYTLKILYKKKNRARKQALIDYYYSLFSLYGEDKSDELIKMANEYTEKTKIDWYTIYPRENWGGIKNGKQKTNTN